MTANNMAQLNSMLMRQLQKAMNVVSEKSLADMYEETGKFYTGGEPEKYKRTGALGDTPRTTPSTSSIGSNGGSVYFEAYLDTAHSYTSGSNPNMKQVLDLANDGIAFTTKNGYPARPTVGKGGFWQESEKKINDNLNNTLSVFFD